MGGTLSLIVPMAAERRGGSSPTYLRLSIGLEDADELIGEVETILDRLDRADQESEASQR